MKYTPAVYLVFLLSCVYLAECNYQKITLLIQPNNREHHELNKRFIHQAIKIGFDVESLSVTRSTVLNTIAAAEKHRNVINLRTTGLCDVKSFKAFQKSKLICISGLEEKPVLHNESSYHCTETQNTYSNGTKAEVVSQIEQTLTTHKKLEAACNTDDGTATHALVHEDVMKHYRLLHIIVNLEDNNYRINDKVLLCIPHILDPQVVRHRIESHYSHLSIEHRKNCTDGMQLDNNIVSILSHTPLELETEVPIIYYSTPKQSDQNGLYINLLKSTQPLKYAFLQLITYMEWRRVAILSDDSISSEVFVHELSPLLEKEAIAFTDQYCSGKFCNFTDALTLLQHAGAKIIILNVDKKNINHAIQQINDTPMKYVHWIMRDWPFPNDVSLRMPMYSITLYPVFESVDGGNADPFLSAIMKGLKILELHYMQAQGVRETFIRSMKNYIHTSQNHKVYAFVTKNQHIHGSMMIRGGHVSRLQFSFRHKPFDLVEACILRSAEYFRPCNDKIILLFLAILTAFLLLIYTIVIFFTRYNSSQYGRMVET